MGLNLITIDIIETKKTTYKVKLKKTTKKASSGKPKDEIRFNYASGHYALVKDKKIVKENKKRLKNLLWFL